MDTALADWTQSDHGTPPVTQPQVTLQKISTDIWDMKYRFRSPSGDAGDGTIEDSWDRVAHALSRCEGRKASHWQGRFRDQLDDFRFLPAGRILSGAGTGRNVTLFNCFVMGTIPDSLGGIFDMLKEAALTMQQGGGIGYDFSTIRPKGSRVAGVDADASGPLSFMDVWDAMCRTIMSAGSRRGAMMGVMRDHHPDILSFVEAKRDRDRLRNFNLSVLVSDALIRAVDADADWPLHFDGKVHDTLRARDLWDAIMKATYDYAEPGVIFIDRINAANNLSWLEDIAATNPCGEQPLPPYGACLLGSVNLSRFVTDPFSPSARLDTDGLKSCVATAVRMMDNVIDVSNFPLEAQRKEAVNKRRLGLGVTGLGDALVMCGLRYGSEAAVEAVETWMGTIANEAYRTSARLAAEKGAFPLFEADQYLQAPMIQALDADVRDLIAQHGIRNSHLTSIAPTGTISLLANNTSGGVEPVFGYSFVRTVRLPDGGQVDETVEDYAYRVFRTMFGPDAELPDSFVEADALTPREHVVMQAAAQKWIDSSISKTINLPRDIAFETFKNVYRQAYDLGCKGCTTYRPNDITGSVLSKPETAEQAKQRATAAAPTAIATRPVELPGQTYKVRWPHSEHAIYVTINDIIEDIDDGAGATERVRKPFEVFINSKNMDHYAWTLALTRMISAVFRRGGDVRFVAEELGAVFDPQGGAFVEGRYAPSLLAVIGGVIERHLNALDSGALPLTLLSEQARGRAGTAEIEEIAAPPPGLLCPKCHQPSLIKQEGCITCSGCGYSKCG
ncbi:adenosylcobalamin-dependent ribonucleoside-diphosphate reductase [Hyphobacterium marinum]|uniref:Vitamin B12-dependent ribonucleotide reductase n=1 Tax=Hyphobacterium marinum TaxID=3116574 RepID=A0ABU7LU67_9PROT|nr:adenosylcobalamin-dependent ribonucleoside-diphosphate reductase [Hyphobacterium sp. Y6023]MEE2565107.1 adenosylcobalamin-dependent ribonucleoside-diphosphate reductase [Hyphobacterium sp. Y6023]